MFLKWYLNGKEKRGLQCLHIQGDKFMHNNKHFKQSKIMSNVEKSYG